MRLSSTHLTTNHVVLFVFFHFSVFATARNLTVFTQTNVSTQYLTDPKLNLPFTSFLYISAGQDPVKEPPATIRIAHVPDMNSSLSGNVTNVDQSDEGSPASILYIQHLGNFSLPPAINSPNTLAWHAHYIGDVDPNKVEDKSLMRTWGTGLLADIWEMTAAELDKKYWVGLADENVYILKLLEKWGVTNNAGYQSFNKQLQSWRLLAKATGKTKTVKVNAMRIDMTNAGQGKVWSNDLNTQLKEGLADIKDKTVEIRSVDFIDKLKNPNPYLPTSLQPSDSASSLHGARSLDPAVTRVSGKVYQTKITFVRTGGIFSSLSVISYQAAHILNELVRVFATAICIVDFVDGDYVGGALGLFGVAFATIFPMIMDNPIGVIFGTVIAMLFFILPGQFKGTKTLPPVKNATEIIQYAFFGDAKHTGNDACAKEHPGCVASYGPGILSLTFKWEWFDAIVFMIWFNEGLAGTIPDIANAFGPALAFDKDVGVNTTSVAQISCGANPASMPTTSRGGPSWTKGNPNFCMKPKFYLRREKIMLPRINRTAADVYKDIINPNGGSCKIINNADNPVTVPNYGIVIQGLPVAIACGINATMPGLNATSANGTMANVTSSATLSATQNVTSTMPLVTGDASASGDAWARTGNGTLGTIVPFADRISSDRTLRTLTVPSTISPDLSSVSAMPSPLFQNATIRSAQFLANTASRSGVSTTSMASATITQSLNSSYPASSSPTRYPVSRIYLPNVNLPGGADGTNYNGSLINEIGNGLDVPSSLQAAFRPVSTSRLLPYTNNGSVEDLESSATGLPSTTTALSASITVTPANTTVSFAPSWPLSFVSVAREAISSTSMSQNASSVTTSAPVVSSSMVQAVLNSSTEDLPETTRSRGANLIEADFSTSIGAISISLPTSLVPLPATGTVMRVVPLPTGSVYEDVSPSSQNSSDRYSIAQVVLANGVTRPGEFGTATSTTSSLPESASSSSTTESSPSVRSYTSPDTLTSSSSVPPPAQPGLWMSSSMALSLSSATSSSTTASSTVTSSTTSTSSSSPDTSSSTSASSTTLTSLPTSTSSSSSTSVSTSSSISSSTSSTTSSSTSSSTLSTLSSTSRSSTTSSKPTAISITALNAQVSSAARGISSSHSSRSTTTTSQSSTSTSVEVIEMTSTFNPETVSAFQALSSLTALPSGWSPGSQSTDGRDGEGYVPPPTAKEFEKSLNTTNAACFTTDTMKTPYCLPNGTYDHQDGAFGFNSKKVMSATFPQGASINVRFIESLTYGAYLDKTNTFTANQSSNAKSNFAKNMAAMQKKSFDVIIPNIKTPPMACLYTDKSFAGDATCYGLGGGNVTDEAAQKAMSVGIVGAATVNLYPLYYGDAGGLAFTVSISDLSTVPYGVNGSFAGSVKGMWISDAIDYITK